MSTRGNNKKRDQQSAAGASAAAAPKEGGRGGRGRPQTTKGRGERGTDDTKGRPNTAAGGERGRGRGGRGGNQGRAAQDPDSWINKFHALQRPKYEDIEFTMDTEIPELPAKEDRLKEPSKDKFEAAMAEIEK